MSQKTMEAQKLFMIKYMQRYAFAFGSFSYGLYGKALLPTVFMEETVPLRSLWGSIERLWRLVGYTQKNRKDFPQ